MLENSLGPQGAAAFGIVGRGEQHDVHARLLQSAHELAVDTGDGGVHDGDLAQPGQCRCQHLRGIGAAAHDAHEAAGPVERGDELRLRGARNGEQHPADHGALPGTGRTTTSRSPASAPSTRDSSPRGTSTWAALPPVGEKIESDAITSATMRLSASTLGSSALTSLTRCPARAGAVSHRSTMLPLSTPGGTPRPSGTVTGRSSRLAAEPIALRGTSSPASITRVTTASSASASLAGT